MPLARSGGGEPGDAADLVASGELALADGTAESEVRALRSFESATEADPGSALAWSGLAAARWTLVSRGEISRSVGLPQAELAAMRAIELDSTLSRPWTTLGLVHTAHWKWEEAESALRRATELDDDSGHAHGALAQFLLLTGRHGEARTEIEIALASSPGSPKVLHMAGFVYSMLRDDERATHLYREIVRLRPGDADAQAQLEKLRAGRRSFPDSEITVAEIDQLLKKQPLRPAIVAGMFAEAGEEQKAVEWLRRARDEKDLSLLLVRFDDRWTRLHGDERYRSILDDVGL